MFENLDWYEILALVVLAFLLFGDRLPQVIADGLRMVRKLRDMARNATGDLSRELGTEVRLEDLHPKTFVRKHLLSEQEQEALTKPLRGAYDDLRKDLDDVAAQTDLRGGGGSRRRTPARSFGAGSTHASAPAAAAAAGTPAAAEPPAGSFDLDAT